MIYLSYIFQVRDVLYDFTILQNELFIFISAKFSTNSYIKLTTDSLSINYFINRIFFTGILRQFFVFDGG